MQIRKIKLAKEFIDIKIKNLEILIKKTNNEDNRMEFGQIYDDISSITQNMCVYHEKMKIVNNLLNNPKIDIKTNEIDNLPEKLHKYLISEPEIEIIDELKGIYQGNLILLQKIDLNHDNNLINLFKFGKIVVVLNEIIDFLSRKPRFCSSINDNSKFSSTNLILF